MNKSSISISLFQHNLVVLLDLECITDHFKSQQFLIPERLHFWLNVVLDFYLRPIRRLSGVLAFAIEMVVVPCFIHNLGGICTSYIHFLGSLCKGFRNFLPQSQLAQSSSVENSGVYTFVSHTHEYGLGHS